MFILIHPRGRILTLTVRHFERTINLSGANLKKFYAGYESDFTKADLTNTNIGEADFSEAILCNTKTPWDIENTGCK